MIVLKALLLPIFGILLVNSSFAAKWAVVNSDWAIVYADRHMTNAIGKVRKGRRIRVGETRRNKARLLPIVVSGKVAYIKIRDIRTDDEIERLSLASERIANQLTTHKYYGVGPYASTYFSTVEVESNSDVAEKEISQTGYGFIGHYKGPMTNFGYRSVIEYVGFTDSGDLATEKFNYYNVAIASQYFILNNDFYNLSFFLGINMMPMAQYVMDGLFSVSGYGYGGHGGAEFVFKLTDNFGVLVDAGYTYLTTTGLELPDNPNYPTDINPVFSGSKVSAALRWVY